MSLEHIAKEILDGMVEMSGLILFRVTGTWAHQGREGEINEVVVARDAVEAIRRAWMTEDDRDLRTVHVEWLCPVECVQKWSEIEEGGGDER